MKLDNVKAVYFVGIGGIGMSALARWFAAQGLPVFGYDRTPTSLTQALETEGIKVHFEDSLQQIPELVKEQKDQTLVVFTPAIPKDHQELNYFKEQGYQLLKRAEVLGMIASGHFTIAVAGTHGKTTTSSMVAWLLHSAGKNCTAFLGGLSTNFNSNLLLSAQKEEQLVVVEADEYDRSFLHLHPQIAVITSTDADHLDIYGQHDQLLGGFQQFASQIAKGGTLFRQQALDAALQATNTFTYSLNEGNWHTKNVQITDAKFEFDAIGPGVELKNLVLQLPGFHNVENALAAIAVAHQLGLTAAQIKEGVRTYKGVKRRFEYHVQTSDVVYIDDYAHHPSEINAFLSSVKALYPGRKITAIFQPHLFTRTRDFAAGFAESLSLADELILLPIYPARELPLPGITSELLLDAANVDKKSLISKDNIIAYLEKKPVLDILCTIGAGDIDTLVQPIINLLNKQHNAVE